MHGDDVDPLASGVIAVAPGDEQLRVERRVGEHRGARRGDRHVGLDDQPVGTAGAQPDLRIEPPDAVTEPHRTRRQRRQQRFGFAVRSSDVGVGAEHVLERHQSERTGQRVRDGEPGPELAGSGDVAVVAAGSHRGHLRERRGLREVRRRAHAPLQGDAPVGRGPVDALLPRPGPARFASQSLDTEEHLDQPVVLEGLDTPGDALVEPAFVALRRGGHGVRTVDVDGNLLGDRRVRSEVTDVRDERRVAEPVTQCSDAVGQHVGTGLPREHRGRRDDPLVGVERAALDVRVEPRVELHRTDRHPRVAEPLDRGDDRSGDVVAGFGPVPVGGAVVGPVRGTACERVGPAAGPDGPGTPEQQRAPCIEALPRTGSGEHRHLGAEPGGDPVEIAVPTDADGAAVEADGLVVEVAERCHQQGSAGAVGEQQRPTRRWTVGEQDEPVELRSGRGWEGELAVLERECPQPVGRSVGVTFRRREHRPADRRHVERTGGQAVDVLRRRDREHDERTVAVGADAAAQRPVGHEHLVGRAEVVGDLADGPAIGRERASARSEPVRAVESDSHGRVVIDVDGQASRCAELHAGSLVVFHVVGRRMQDRRYDRVP